MFLNALVLNGERSRKLLLPHLTFLRAVPNRVLFLTSILRYVLPLCKHLQASIPQVLNLPLFPLLCKKQKECQRPKKRFAAFLLRAA